MLNSTQLRSDLDLAIHNFVTALTRLADATVPKSPPPARVKKDLAQKPKRAAKAKASSPTPAPKRRKVDDAQRRIEQAARAVERAAREAEQAPRKAESVAREVVEPPTAERLGEQVVERVRESATGINLEQLASELGQSVETLQPIVESLVADQRIRNQAQDDGSTLYRRPRIEPIRRRRPEDNADGAAPSGAQRAD